MYTVTAATRDVLHDLLHGTLDPDNPLAALRANPLVWTNIFSRVDKWYTDHIDTKSVAYSCKLMDDYYGLFYNNIHNAVDFPKKDIRFPIPNDININMMPFEIYNPYNTLPVYLRNYLFIINGCMQDVNRSYQDRIAYLTIQEGLVPVGQSQRRSGLHIERPSGVILNSSDKKDTLYAARTFGAGYYSDVPIDGIYMASTVANSCKVWPALITNPEEVADFHGGIEPLRDYLGEGYALAANELCWLTDRTPHESLPLSAPTDDQTATHVYRQFFRLVVGPLSVWYSKINTPNPLGIQPNAPISDADKFASDP